MIKVINYMLFLTLLLFSILLCSSANEQSDENKINEIDSNSIDWLNHTELPWIFPIFQLANSKIPSRRYHRIFRCSGLLVHRNAVLAPRLCINDDNWYVIALSMIQLSSSGRKFLPYVYHHRLYPAIDYETYRLSSIEYKKNYADTIIVKNDTIPGMVLLFFDTTIHYTKPVRMFESPQFYQTYSKTRNQDCVRISMKSDAQRQISTHRTPKKILPYDDFVGRYKRSKHSSHDNKTTRVQYIDFDSFTPVFATRQDESSDLETLLGSALVCRGQNNTPILTGVLINTLYDGLDIYALVGGMYNWILYRGFDFKSRTERLTFSETDPYETRYEYDLP